jgi:glutamate racemase
MEPAVKPAVAMNRLTGKRVLVLATQLTLTQTKYMELISQIDDQHIVDGLPLPELVEFCEELNFDSSFIHDYLNNKLAAFNLSHYGTVVLGCTHYPFYTSILRKLLPNHIQIIDGSAGTVNRLAQLLSQNNLLNSHGTASIKFLCSSNDHHYVHKMKRALEWIQGSSEEQEGED